MGASRKKAAGRKLQTTSKHATGSQRTPVPARNRSESIDRMSDKETREAQAEFLHALEESVQQANDAELTPIEPLLEDLWARYGDGQDSSN